LTKFARIDASDGQASCEQSSDDAAWAAENSESPWRPTHSTGSVNLRGLILEIDMYGNAAVA
jgi:hypothetical protein